MTKTFTPKPGDKWTRDEDVMLWVYRKDCAVVFSRTGFTAGPVTCRSAHETDLPTPDAHAQLREWGYEVSGDEKPITEARVKEIVAQMLAAQPTPAEVREAANVASDPKTEWVEVDNCRIQAVSVDGVVFAYMLRSPCGKLYLMADLTWKPLGGGDAVMVWDTQEKARAALAKAPPPPDVADFNGLKEAVAPKPTAERLLADLVEAWNATYPLEAKLPESVLPFVNSPALAAARGYLAREYFASTKGMVK